MNKVIVHPWPDLDLCTCVALAGVVPKDVHFLAANAPGVPPVCPCCGEPLTGNERILDHPLGEKGRLGANGMRHSAAASMPEAAGADPDLLAEVEQQDLTGRSESRFNLTRIIQAVRAEAGERGLKGPALDREVVAVMSRIIRGLNLWHAERERSRALVRQIRIEEVGGYKFAIPPRGDVPPALETALKQETDVSGIIYHNEFNLGVACFPGRPAPDLRRVQASLPGWFVHTAGFIACWGSRKSPATSPPPAGTPQTQEDLLALLRKEFANP